MKKNKQCRHHCIHQTLHSFWRYFRLWLCCVVKHSMRIRIRIRMRMRMCCLLMPRFKRFSFQFCVLLPHPYSFFQCFFSFSSLLFSSSSSLRVSLAHYVAVSYSHFIHHFSLEFAQDLYQMFCALRSHNFSFIQTNNTKISDYFFVSMLHFK